MSAAVTMEARCGVTVDGRYELTREIARGAFSTVFEARHRFVGRAVVLKIAPHDAPDGEAAERLMREARALDAVRHPGVVDVIDAGFCATYGHFIALEKLEGRTLDGILASRYRLSPDESVHLIVDLCRTLAHVHRRGVVHRDLKPANVFVSWNARGEERTRLLDLGISRLGGDLLSATDRKLTGVGEILGTPDYMAPEQLMGQHDRIDARTDVYAAAVMLWECLTGDVPVTGSYPEILHFYARNARVPPIGTVLRSLPVDLAAVIDRALDPQPDERFPGARAFARALDTALPSARAPTRLLGPRPATMDPDEDPSERAPVHPGVDPGTQRRRFPRAPYLAPVRVIRADGSSVDGRSEDVSAAGMLVLLPSACVPDERVYVRFALPTTGTIIVAAAVVRWVREGRGRVATGLEFDAPASALTDAIQRYVALMGPG